MLFHGLDIKKERNHQESEFAVKKGQFHLYHKRKRMIQRKQIYKLLVYLTLIFFPASFYPHFKPFSSKSFCIATQGIVLILSMHML